MKLWYVLQSEIYKGYAYSIGTFVETDKNFGVMKKGTYRPHCKKYSVPSTPNALHTYGMLTHLTCAGVWDTPNHWCAVTPGVPHTQNKRIHLVQ